MLQPNDFFVILVKTASLLGLIIHLVDKCLLDCKTLTSVFSFSFYELLQAAYSLKIILFLVCLFFCSDLYIVTLMHIRLELLVKDTIFVSFFIAADIILWKKRRVSFGIIVFATVVWLLFERSGLSSLSICSDVLLFLVVSRFLLVQYASFRNRQLQELPELEMSEEMINSAAATFRGKVNYALLMAHDITLGKDFRLFSKVVVFLWLFSVIGSYISFFTIAYIGVILSIIIPPLYGKYRNIVDQISGSANQKVSGQYRIVDESVNSRFPRTLSKEKDY